MWVLGGRFVSMHVVPRSEEAATREDRVKETGPHLLEKIESPLVREEGVSSTGGGNGEVDSAGDTDEQGGVAQQGMEDGHNSGSVPPNHNQPDHGGERASSSDQPIPAVPLNIPLPHSHIIPPFNLPRVSLSSFNLLDLGLGFGTPRR